MLIKNLTIIGLLISLYILQTSSVFAQSDLESLQQHKAFTEVLFRTVDPKGLVNYVELCSDNQFNDYVKSLSNTDWNSLNQNDQLAFWINVYNAFTLKIICDNYPVKSISELHTGGLIIGSVFKSTIWDKKFFNINGEPMSLGFVEHEILRKGEEKARIHFAIVCAAVSCPPLRQEAYEGSIIDRQLDEQGKVFLSREDLNKFDLNKKRARLSGIFNWFLKDFGKNRTELLTFLSQYAPSETIKKSLEENAEQWRISWKKYDWSLNEWKKGN